MPPVNWSELGVGELPTGTVTLLLADVEGSTPEVLRTDRQPLRMEVHQDDLNALTRHEYATEIPRQTT
jgi:hypothetical protein